MKKLRSPEGKLENGLESNHVDSVAGAGGCHPKCVCGVGVGSAIKCSGLTKDDFRPGMFSGDNIVKM